MEVRFIKPEEAIAYNKISAASFILKYLFLVLFITESLLQVLRFSTSNATTAIIL